MPLFKCQEVIEDDPDEWDEIEAYDSEEAAKKFAARRDDHSGGDCFKDPTKDTMEVRVRYGAAAPQIVEVSFGYSKDFYSRVVVHAESET